MNSLGDLNRFKNPNISMNCIVQQMQGRATPDREGIEFWVGCGAPQQHSILESAGAQCWNNKIDMDDLDVYRSFDSEEWVFSLRKFGAGPGSICLPA